MHKRNAGRNTGNLNNTNTMNQARMDRAVRSGVRASVWLPDVVLRLKGRVDARRGTEICEKYICKVNSRCGALEASEKVRLEKRLYQTRKESDRLSRELTSVKEKLSQLPAFAEGDNAGAVRTNRRIAERKRLLEEEECRVSSKLGECEARIRCQCDIFEKRVHRMRAMTASKIHAYEVGVRDTGEPVSCNGRGAI